MKYILFGEEWTGIEVGTVYDNKAEVMIHFFNAWHNGDGAYARVSIFEYDDIPFDNTASFGWWCDSKNKNGELLSDWFRKTSYRQIAHYPLEEAWL